MLDWARVPRPNYQEILMNNRGRKRRLTLQQRKNGRLPIRLILSAEDRAWLDMPPVGREFGSIEFEDEVRYGLTRSTVDTCTKS